MFAINPLVDAAGRAIVIRAQVRNADTALRPGHVRARAAHHARTSATRWSCPSRRSCRRATSSSCSRVVDGKAVRTKVERRPAPRRQGRDRQGRRARATTIVTAGQLKLRDGVAGDASAARGRRRRRTPPAPRRRRRRRRRRPRPTRRAARRAEVLTGEADRHAAARDLHQAARLRDGAVAGHPADRPHLVHAAVGARVPADRRAGGQRVSTTYRGASAEVVESQVTKPLEDSLAGIEGVEVMTSQSRSETQPDQRPLHAEARSRLGGGRRPRQGGARARQAARHDRRADHRQGRGRLATRSSTSPSQAGSLTPLEASDYVKRYVQPRLSVLPGAADVRIFGERQVSMRINLDRTRLAAYKLTVQDVEDAIRRQNAEIPAGRIESHGARVHGRRRDRRAARPSSSTTSSSPTSAATRCASATSATSAIGAGRRARRSRASTASRRSTSASSSRRSANPLELSKAVRAEVDKINEDAAARHEARSSPTTRRCSSTARSSRCSRRSARRSCWSCW